MIMMASSLEAVGQADMEACWLVAKQKYKRVDGWIGK